MPLTRSEARVRQRKLSARTIRRNHRSAELLISTGSEWPSNGSRAKELKARAGQPVLSSSFSPNRFPWRRRSRQAASQLPPRSSSLPQQEIPIIHDETQIESPRDGGEREKKRKKKKRAGEAVDEAKRGSDKRAGVTGEENWNPSGTEDDKIADGQVLP